MDPADEILARIINENNVEERQLDHFRRVGQVIGVVYKGIESTGVPLDDVLELTTQWIELHLFDRIQAAYGYHPTSDDDSDSASEGEHA